MKLLLAGFVVWAGAFLLIYALHAVGCSSGLQAGSLRALMIAAFCLGVAAGGVPLWLALQSRGPLRFSAICASVAALGASVLTFSGVFWAGLC